MFCFTFMGMSGILKSGMPLSFGIKSPNPPPGRRSTSMVEALITLYLKAHVSDEVAVGGELHRECHGSLELPGADQELLGFAAAASTAFENKNQDDDDGHHQNA